MIYLSSALEFILGKQQFKGAIQIYMKDRINIELINISLKGAPNGTTCDSEKIRVFKNNR